MKLGFIAIRAVPLVPLAYGEIRYGTLEQQAFIQTTLDKMRPMVPQNIDGVRTMPQYQKAAGWCRIS
jgi:hypothetical protein